MRIPRFLVLLSLATLVLCAASFADTTFDFSTNVPQDINAQTAKFTIGSLSITLSAWDSNGVMKSGTNLWFKNEGVGETGVGLTNDPTTGQNEIAGNSFVQLTGLGITSLTLNSVQSGEGYKIWGDTTSGQGDGAGAMLLATGSADDTVKISGTFNFFSVFANGGNILLNSATVAAPAVPEPSTPAFMLTLGLVGLFEVGRRKLMA